MKNAYLNNVFISRLIKNTTKITKNTPKQKIQQK